MRATLPLLQETDFPAIDRYRLDTLQVNLGYRCNQTCFHCHVAAGPNRKENMTFETVRQIVELLNSANIQTLDLTGGAPELNPNFRHLVSRAKESGIHVMDRCNLTILEQPGQEDLAEFLADHQVEVVASLPCYTEDNVDAQRGDGVFDESIRGLQRLNALGYGKESSGLILNLVYNPLGAFLPPPQQALQADYKKHLGEKFGIEFTQLFTLANMPIQRFGNTLIKEGRFDEYMALLKNAYSPANLENVMCRNLLSVDWQGYVYDCDFNQMLQLPMRWKGRPRTHIKDLLDVDISGNPIVIADHCYGCTAGQGSSCGGALA